jgi:hypothetical protein
MGIGDRIRNAAQKLGGTGRLASGRTPAGGRTAGGAGSNPELRNIGARILGAFRRKR